MTNHAHLRPRAVGPRRHLTGGRFYQDITRRRRWRDEAGFLHVDIEQDAVSWKPTQAPPMKLRARRHQGSKAAAASRRANR